MATANASDQCETPATFRFHRISPNIPKHTEISGKCFGEILLNRALRETTAMPIKPARLNPGSIAKVWNNYTQAATRMPHGWSGPSISLQILGLLVGGLVVAQCVTLFLTLVLPPEPARRYELDDVAAALRGTAGVIPGTLHRSVQEKPPQASGPGWLESERSQRELAAHLDVDEADVRLLFYTPLPFAGTTTQPRSSVVALRTVETTGALQIKAAGFALPPRPMQPAAMSASPQRPRGDAMRGGRAFSLPQRFGAPDRGNKPIGHDAERNDWLLRSTTPRFGDPAKMPQQPERSERTGAALALPHGLQTETSRSANISVGLAQRVPEHEAPRKFQIGSDTDRRYPGSWFQPPALADRNERTDDFRLPEPLPATTDPVTTTIRQPRSNDPTAPPSTDSPPPETKAHPDTVSGIAAKKVVSAATPVPTVTDVPTSLTRRGLFGLAPAPFVEGDFIAALRLSDGRWAVVQPVPEPFPNAWQRRVLLWFTVAIAIVGPLGWLFARRIVTPLAGFAHAAEQLGRDPTGPVRILRGPGELGRAANAFNVMQSRLHAFIEDRTTMVGAISHDLRTPLTRLRFRIEDIDDDTLRDGIVAEVDDMETMIASVLDYLRDATAGGRREHFDLAELVYMAVRDAALVGVEIKVDRLASATIVAEPLGIRRILDNLFQNAVKYGGNARVHLGTDSGAVIIEVIDEGPGVPEDELEKVFTPFYRSRSASSSGKPGSGLGLAVCRSIARAHGGDVRLIRGANGFIARLELPLAFAALKASREVAEPTAGPQARHYFPYSVLRSTLSVPRRESLDRAVAQNGRTLTPHAEVDG